jgi:hypothetical protein
MAGLLEEMVEAAAKGVWENDCDEGDSGMTWDTLLPAVRERYREDATAALTAADVPRLLRVERENERLREALRRIIEVPLDSVAITEGTHRKIAHAELDTPDPEREVDDG